MPQFPMSSNAIPGQAIDIERLFIESRRRQADVHRPRCEVCRMQFLLNSDLQSHIEENHPDHPNHLQAMRNAQQRNTKGDIPFKPRDVQNPLRSDIPSTKPKPTLQTRAASNFDPTTQTSSLDENQSRRLRSPASAWEFKSKRDNESSLPPKRSRARAPIQASSATVTSDNEFQRETIQKNGNLWTPDEGLSRNRGTTEPPRTPAPRSFEPCEPHTLDDTEVLIKQPETRPISQEQLVAEVKGIYAGLVMVESKCIEVDNAQDSKSESATKLNNEQWQALIALHRTLLHEHHDFFLASQHPSANPALRRLANKYAMPARMWRHGIHNFLELLRDRLPASLEHMLTFIYLAYSMMALLYETVPTFNDTWIKGLGDLGRYQMAMEKDGLKYAHEVSSSGRDQKQLDRSVESLAQQPETHLKRHNEWNLWLNQDPDSFWLRGIPGKGKSTLIQPFNQHNSALLQNMAARRHTNYSSGTDYIVDGSINGVSVAASPDTGSDDCIISSNLAARLNLKPVPGTTKTITLANKKPVLSPGMVEVLWNFANDHTPHSLKCWILPKCSNDFVLGNRFLKATKTLTTHFFSRIKKLISPGRLRVRLIGGEKERILGFFNGRIATALADTGSDIMVVSADYARRMGLHVESGPGDLVEVEFADKTRTWTSGIVRDVLWTVEGREVYCDFHVLDGLAVDVILGKDYLFDLDVFSTCAGSFFDIDSVAGMSLLCGIRLVEDHTFDWTSLEAEFLQDGSRLMTPSAKRIFERSVSGATWLATESSNYLRESKKLHLLWNETREKDGRRQRKLTKGCGLDDRHCCQKSIMLHEALQAPGRLQSKAGS
nr:uncharacterized protein CTRU02_12609 [Colletotrichum truncatum]KAF6784347.1 hypothetical protein CTRU02_12609 [Colletotrichum truncatum]